MTRAELVAAMLALVPARVAPEQIATLEPWERERMAARAGAQGCSPEAWNELILAVWARGSYRRHDV